MLRSIQSDAQATNQHWIYVFAEPSNVGVGP